MRLKRLSVPQPVKRSLLHLPPTLSSVSAAAEIEPPYHYSEELPDAAIAGWVFPREWVFGHDALLDLLFGITGTLRVKGVFHTEKGWIFFNATRHETAINSEPARADSRFEIIAPVHGGNPRDWPALSAALLALRRQD